MVCFCKNIELPSAPPSDRLRIDAPPPQLANMLKLMRFNANLEMRPDLALADLLPQDSNWLSANISAQAPNGVLPSVLPPRGGPILSLAAQLAVPAALFPLDDLEALMDGLTEAILSLEEHVMEDVHSISRMPSPSYSSLSLGAQLTLELRTMGLCPFEVMEMELNESVSASELLGVEKSMATQTAAMQFSYRLPKLSLPAFGLPLPQLQLAMELEGIATSVAALNKPPLTPEFIDQLKRQFDALRHFPLPQLKTPLPLLMAFAAEMADLDAIHEAFGEDALTPDGMMRINTMFGHWSKKRIFMPLPAIALQNQFELLPDLQDVIDGGQTANAAGPALMKSMTMHMPPPPITPFLEVISALGSVLSKFMGATPFGACGACDMLG